MAKRKGARGTGRKKASKRVGRTRSRARAARPVRKTGAARKKIVARKKGAGRKKGAARKVARATARKSAPRKMARRRPAARATRASDAGKTRRAAVARKVPALNRERRTVRDEDLVPTPPSSLNLDRSASAARSGRRELAEKYQKHTETSPALTGGDVDADWESAYSVGDEAPGGDNPTPDQDVADDIGKAIGVQYEDNEELKGEKKISDRDRKRWVLDPASSEDY